MSEPTPDYRKIYQDLMRNAGERKRKLSAKMLANERRFRVEQRRRKLTGAARVEDDLWQHARRLHAVAEIEHELAKLKLKLAAATETEERIMLKVEIAHLQALKSDIRHGPTRNRPRKPPEAGIPVPAIPPTGPLPMQGGAEAPLDFER